VKISGWQELVMDLEDHVYQRMKKNLYSINFWHTGEGQEEFPYKYANDGVPAVLSNMTNTYVDFAYTPDKLEEVFRGVVLLTSAAVSLSFHMTSIAR
jgi:hypothetical protein